MIVNTLFILDAGGVAGVVIGVLVLVGALLGFLGFAIFKQHQKTLLMQEVRLVSPSCLFIFFVLFFVLFCLMKFPFLNWFHDSP